MAVLAANELLRDDARLKTDVGIVTVGDYFDFPGSDGRDGEAILRWLSAHDRDQVRILFGNHDFVRVQEFAAIGDDEFARAQSEAERVAEGQLSEAAFVAKFNLPSSDIVRRDFSAFRASQRDLVQTLLVEERAEAALAAKLKNGVEVLVTHAGVCARQLVHLSSRSAPDLADELNAFLRARTGALPLDLTPLHTAGVAGREGGGMFFHRAVDRALYDDERFEGPHSRLFAPGELPADLVQVVGHSGHRKSLEKLRRFASPDARGQSFSALRLLREVQSDPGFEYGPFSLNKVSARGLIMIDGAMHRADPSEYELLALAEVM